MDKQVASNSRTRIVLSAILIVGFFFWSIFFFYYLLSAYPHTAPDRLVAWYGTVIAVLFIFLGIAVGTGAKVKTIVIGSVICIAWSLGLLIISVPEGYGEAVLGSYAILLMIAIALYSKYEKSKRKKVQ